MDVMNLLQVLPEVADALVSGTAVVALESTVITHGLEYPLNVETAQKMEAAIREQGAVPATIAIIDGTPMIGLSNDQLDFIAQEKDTRKCSRRDIPIALGLGETAGTTVAGTMIFAQAAGIRVFATGGIGGVHRGTPFDVSADLEELGRTPVAVVCSGAKSILDLPLTLEVLESKGVPILGYKTDQLPEFYALGSGLPIDARVDSPEEVASIMKAADAMNARHGILVTVPVPEDVAMDPQMAEEAIVQATAEAQGIHGRYVTPFMLARVAELTSNVSKRANTALLANNASVAASIAIAYGR